MFWSHFKPSILYKTVQKTKNNKLSEKLDKHVMRSKKYIQIDTMDAFVHLIFHYVYFDAYIFFASHYVPLFFMLT